MSGVGPGWGGQQPNIKGGVFSLYEQKQRRVTVSHTYTHTDTESTTRLMIGPDNIWFNTGIIYPLSCSK